MGLTYFKRYRMELNLEGPIFEPPGLPAGYRLLAWHDSLLECHAEAKYQSFCIEIDANVFPCLGDRAGCQRLMREISRREGFRRREVPPEQGQGKSRPARVFERCQDRRARHEGSDASGKEKRTSGKCAIFLYK